MSAVYEAEQISLLRTVALKVADPEITSRAGFLERFEQEAKIIARLEHAHILPVHDVGQDGEYFYLVMRLVRDGTLNEWLQRGDPVRTPAEALLLAQQVLPALDYAHQQGVVHRDLKPSNVLMQGDWAWLTDFGVAKLLNPDLDLGLTRGQTFLGTPEYMAPEQVLGKPLDGRADLYAFGVILYQMLTGQVPYQGETPMGVAVQRLMGPPPPPRQLNPALPAAVEEVLLQALAREPEDRFPNGITFVDVLAQAVAAGDRQAREPEVVPVGRSLAQGDTRSQSLVPEVAPQPRGVAVAVPNPPTPVPVDFQQAEIAPRRPPWWVWAGIAALVLLLLGGVAAAGSGILSGRVGPVEPTTVPTVQPTLSPAPPTKVPVAPPLGSARYLHTGTTLSNGRFLVTGGKDGSRYLATAELYDPAANRWTPAGTMAKARSGHTATLLSSGRVLVVGGQESDTSYLATAELYDPTTNAWTPAGSMATARSGHTATLLANGQVLVAGGMNSSTFAATAELYDPTTNAWTSAGTMADARSGHTATRLANGQVLVAGGFGARSEAAAERYDPASNSWSTAGSMADGRIGHTATLLPDGRVLVAGGTNTSGRGTYLSSAERYDPATNAWTPAGSMASTRGGHTATLLPNTPGQVLVAGGRDANSVLASAERYDPATNAWTPAGGMSQARWLGTATTPPGGGVLVVGGQDGSTALASADRYDPVTNAWTAG
jgi:N-acetylneuraminic acid mutarotase